MDVTHYVSQNPHWKLEDAINKKKQNPQYTKFFNTLTDNIHQTSDINIDSVSETSPRILGHFDDVIEPHTDVELYYDVGPSPPPSSFIHPASIKISNINKDRETPLLDNPTIQTTHDNIVKSHNTDKFDNSKITTDKEPANVEPNLNIKTELNENNIAVNSGDKKTKKRKGGKGGKGRKGGKGLKAGKGREIYNAAAPKENYKTLDDVHDKQKNKGRDKKDVQGSGVHESQQGEADGNSGFNMVMDNVMYQVYEKQRILDVVALRQKLAKENGMEGPYLRPLVCEMGYKNIYTKGLVHDTEGNVENGGVMALLDALGARDNDKLERLILSNGCRLLDPSAAWANDLIGKSINVYRYSKIPGLSSEILASNMLELYCMVLVRDVKFSAYGGDEKIKQCCEYLNQLGGIAFYPKGLIGDYMFRVPIGGSMMGLYVSQFLYRDVRIGGFIHKQKYMTPIEGIDYMVSWESAIRAQNGEVTKKLAGMNPGARYIVTGRDLAYYGYVSNIYDPYYNAIRILEHLGIPRRAKGSKTQQRYINGGVADVEAVLGMVGRNALLAAWYTKWNGMGVRPEAVGIEVERIFKTGHNPCSISDTLLKNSVLPAIYNKQKSYLLPQVYPEGAPLCPGYPSGAATVAGACVTVLKFFYECNHDIEIMQPDADGKYLIKTGKKVTVSAELDKLASNIAYSRAWAGVNFWVDIIAGLKKGERVALSCLSDLVHRYPDKFSITIRRFNDKLAIIQNY